MSEFNKIIIKAGEFSEKGKHKESIECWKKAIEIEPNYSTGWVMMGQEYEKLKEENQALKCYNEALKVNPQDSDAQWYKAELQREKVSKGTYFAGSEQKTCVYCGATLLPGEGKCAVCGAVFLTESEVKNFKGGIFSKGIEQIDIPLEFWKNEDLVFEADIKFYLDGRYQNNKKPKEPETVFNQLVKKYKVQMTSQFEQTDYWYLLKFFFISSQFYKADPTGIVLLIAGVPSKLKIKCNCGKVLKEKQWIKGFFVPPSELPGGGTHEYFLRISEKCEKCGKIICIYRPKAGVYMALVLFLGSSLKTIYPNMNNNLDITTDEGFLVHWVTIIDSLIQKNPEKICSLYYEDIQKVWNLMETHKGLSQEHKEEMKKIFPLNDFIKQYKDFFRHKGKTLLAFLSKGILLILS